MQTFEKHQRLFGFQQATKPSRGLVHLLSPMVQPRPQSLFVFFFFFMANLQVMLPYTSLTKTSRSEWLPISAKPTMFRVPGLCTLTVLSDLNLMSLKAWFLTKCGWRFTQITQIGAYRSHRSLLLAYPCPFCHW